MTDLHAPDGFTIVVASTDPDRAVAQRFLAQHLDLAPDAVPQTRYDTLYDPVVLLARGPDGKVGGGLLACRPQVVAGMSMLRGASPATSEVMELDLLAVAPDTAGQVWGQRSSRRVRRGSRRRAPGSSSGR